MFMMNTFLLLFTKVCHAAKFTNRCHVNFSFGEGGVTVFNESSTNNFINCVSWIEASAYVKLTATNFLLRLIMD